MNLTAALRKWLTENAQVDKAAPDDAFRKAAADAVMSGKLTPAKMAELTADARSEGELRITAVVADATKGFVTREELAATVKEAMAGFDWKTVLGMVPPGAGGQPPAGVPAPQPPAPPASPDLSELAKSALADQMRSLGLSPQQLDPQYLLTRGIDGKSGGVVEAHRVRLKSAVERYDGGRTQALHPGKSALVGKRGQPVEHMNRLIQTASQSDKAVIGAVSKWHITASMGRPGWKMSEHEHDLLEYAVREMPWTGYVGGDENSVNAKRIDDRRLDPVEQKALLNDAVSGGVYAVPVVYDDQAVLAPIQTGELFPLVSTTPLARGRVVKAFSIGTPVLSSGVPEGTPIPLFDTTGFIAGLDTYIYPVVGSIEIGLDFEEDSPANFGQIVIDRYGEKHLEWLDEQIANGDGVIEPLGVFNTGTLTVVPSVSGPGGPPSLSDLEALIFGVNRLYRRSAGGRMVFIMSDVTYRRFRAIATALGWNTRLFGTDYESYTILGYPVRIMPTIPNNKVAFVNLAYYRMYRRQGLSVRVSTEGKDLISRNMRYIAVRALWGGRIIQGGAGALMVDLQP